MPIGDVIAEWVETSARRLNDASFVQSDLDEFVADGEVPADAIRFALNCFVQIIDELVRLELDADVLLTIPLPWSIGLVLDHPTIDELMQEPWDRLEVPGLYLIRPDHWRDFDDVEEYKMPIPSPVNTRRRVVAYYRTFLPSANRKADAEYPRVIYIRTA